MKYIPHKAEESQQMGLLELRHLYGWEGVGLYWAIVERLMQQEDHRITEHNVRALAVDLNCQYLQDLMDDMVEIGILEHDEEGYYSPRVMEHAEYLDTFRKAGQKGARSRWHGDPKKSDGKKQEKKSSKSPSKGKKKQPDGDPNGNKGNETKLNETKLDMGEQKKRPKKSWLTEEELGVFKDVWLDYLAHRGEKNIGLYASYRSERVGFDRLLQMAGNHVEEAKKIVEQSRANNWQGLFPVKQKTQKSHESRKEKHERFRKGL